MPLRAGAVTCLALASATALAGCSSAPPHAATVTVRIPHAVHYVDEAGACVLRMDPQDSDQPEVAQVGHCFGDQESPGHFDTKAAAGSYRVRVGQYSCGMGQRCPDDPAAKVYGSQAVADWTCVSTVVLTRDGTTTVTADPTQRQGPSSVFACETS